jgi:hypothetical protein
MSDELDFKITGMLVSSRGQLVAYLTYALDEVAFYSEESAALLRMAIADLEAASARDRAGDPVHKLS